VRILAVGARLVLAAAAYLITFGVAYGVLMPAVPPDPTAAQSLFSPAVAAMSMAALHTAVIGWLILRGRQTGWALAGILTFVFFAVTSLMPQVESWIFQASSGMAAHLPSAMIPRILMAGLLHAGLWIPLAVRILGRWRSRAAANEAAPPRPPLSEALRTWKLPLAAAVYVVLYFVFGYYVAWRSPAVRAYYGGTDTGGFWVQMGGVLRDTWWLPLAQVLRGAAWTVIGVVALRSIRGSVLEKTLAVGALFGIVMSAGLLLPNPYMPYDVRMAHYLETTSSNFLFGCIVGWVFRDGSRPVEICP
jgi:hypothetical protein